MAVTTFKNIRDNKSGTLLTAITASQTTLTLNTGQGASFPAAPFYISCDYEVMICTAKVGDVFTVTRGADNTIAAIHAAGSLVEMRSVAALWNDLAAAINAIESGTNPASQASTVANGSIVDASIAANALIALSKLARYPFTNADLASDVPRNNLFVNPGFEIWQHGTASITLTTTGQYLADAWEAVKDGTAAGTYVQTTTNVDTGSGAAAQIGVTATNTGYTGGAFIGSNTVMLRHNTLTDSNILNQLKGQTVTFKYRIKASVPATVVLAYNDGATQQTQGSQVAVGTSYTTLTWTITLGAGITAFRPNIIFTSVATYYIDNATLVIGSVPVDYQPLTPADDLARCLRYYELIVADFINGAAYITTGTAHGLRYSRKGGIPTVTLGAAANFAIGDATGNMTITAISASNIGATGCELVTSGLSRAITANQGCWMTAANQNATIAIEWNP